MARDSQRYRKTYSYYRVQPRTELLEIIADESLDWKHSVRVASTSNISLTGSTPLVIDSKTLSADERVLLKDQGTASQNGIYYVVITGSTYSLVRDTDAAQGTLTCGATTYVEEGASNSGKIYILSTINPITLGTTNLVWTEFTSGGGSGSGSEYWFSTTPSSVYTTGSVAVRGGLSGVDSASDVGSDVFFFVSGSISGFGSQNKKSLFGGDVVMSGSLEVSGDQVEITGSLSVTNGISGSLTCLTDGTAYIVAGPNITINTGSNGAVQITGSAGGTTPEYAQFYTVSQQYAAAVNTAYEIDWQTKAFGSAGITCPGTVGTPDPNITVSTAGKYSVKVRTQGDQTLGSPILLYLWCYLNGSDIDGTLTVWQIPYGTTPNTQCVSAEWFLDIPAGGVLQIRWAAGNTALSLAQQNLSGVTSRAAVIEINKID